MKFTSGLILILLVGCSGSTNKQTINTQHTVVTDKNQVKTIHKQPLKVTSIKALYMLMVAELAVQKTQYAVALDNYLQVSKMLYNPKILERAARIGLFLRDTKSTNIAVNLWLQHEPKNTLARKIAILSVARNLDKATVLKHLHKILQDDPVGFEFTVLELAKTLDQNTYYFVFEILEDLVKLNQNQATVFFVQALLNVRLNKFETAKEKINTVLILRPNWNKALVLRIQLAIKSSELGVARELLEQFLSKSPDDIKIKKMLAQVLIKTHNFDEALQLYKDFLKINPEDQESQFVTAMILMQQNQTDKALIYLKKLVNKPKWDARSCFHIGKIEYKKGHYKQALIWFDKVTSGPHAYEATKTAIFILLKQKKWVEINSRLVALVDKYPQQKLDIFLLQAEVYNTQGNYQQAFDVLSEALLKLPEHRGLLYTRALMAEKLNKLAVFENDLKKILTLNPKDVSALNTLGYVLVDSTDRYKEAELYLTQAIKIQPEEAIIIDSFGWLKFKQGKIQDALKYLRKAYKKLPNNEIAAHFAETLWILGNKIEAKKIIKKAFKKSPNDKYLLKFKRRFLDIDK